MLNALYLYSVLQNFPVLHTRNVQESQQLSVSKSGIEEMQKLNNHNKQTNKQIE
jgi:hypothetical protein